MDTDKLFTGQRLDDTGLYYYNARYYDPEIGRFISADTIVSEPYNPQNLNRYSYCLNNPLKYVDPSGHNNTLSIVPLTGTISYCIYEGNPKDDNLIAIVTGTDGIDQFIPNYAEARGIDPSEVFLIEYLYDPTLPLDDSSPQIIPPNPVLYANPYYPQATITADELDTMMQVEITICDTMSFIADGVSLFTGPLAVPLWFISAGYSTKSMILVDKRYKNGYLTVAQADTAFANYIGGLIPYIGVAGSLNAVLNDFGVDWVSIK